MKLWLDYSTWLLGLWLHSPNCGKCDWVYVKGRILEALCGLQRLADRGESDSGDQRHFDWWCSRLSLWWSCWLGCDEHNYSTCDWLQQGEQASASTTHATLLYKAKADQLQYFCNLVTSAKKVVLLFFLCVCKQDYGKPTFHETRGKV